MNEAFLQYVWQYQLLEGKLVSTEGLPIVVERAGTLNRDAGPDFFDARIKIGDMLWVGNVEIHQRSSEWNAHRHHNDPAYNNVVLHVVFRHDIEVQTAERRVLPTLEVADMLPKVLWDNYETLMRPPAEIAIGCGSRWASYPQMMITSLLDRLAVERIQKKTALVRQLLDETKGNWEQCCYLLVARYFGGKVNAFPFELMARSVDFNFLARWRGSATRMEALLFGQAGLLDEMLYDAYPRELQADYEALRVGAQLKPISAHLWKFFRVRPSSFPTVRISQFAQLLGSTTNLFSKLLDATDVRQIESYFDIEASEYWQTHYRFDEAVPRRHKRVGKTLTDVIIINAWIPLLFEYGSSHANQDLMDRAVALLQQIEAEDNKIVRYWKPLGFVPDSASQSQALIQLYNDYCKPRKCLSCPLGYRYMKETPPFQSTESNG